MFSRLFQNIKELTERLSETKGASGGFTFFRNGSFNAALPMGLLSFFLLVSCARMGQPDGGWFDETPPKIVRTFPADRSTAVKSKKISIVFDEFIKLDNPSEKVVVSPPQLEIPEITASGKHILVQLQDSLKANTTYTIDFSDAISDNNEGNPLGNYTYTFSTGEDIDTMEVAGYVLEAENLEPIKGILVGLYANQADTAFLREPMLRVSRTNDRGYFVIKGVAKRDYRIYALQDADGNYFFNQPAEKIAFTPEVIMPSAISDVRQDTIWQDSLRISDIKRDSYTHFLPDDVVLKAFTEVQTNRYFMKAERQNADHFTLFFSYGHKNLPKLRGLNFNANDAFEVEPSVNQDTITYWLRDTLLINQDTLRMEMQYEGSDSLNNLVLQTDTLEVLAKTPYAKREKKRQEEYDKWLKQQNKNKERGKDYQSEFPADPYGVKYNVGSLMAPDENISFDFQSPLAELDTTKIHLYEKIDTLWYRTKYQLGADPNVPRRYKLVGAWNAGHEYSLEIDSTAFTDIYGKTSDKYKQGFKVKALSEFATLIITVEGMKGKNCVVQLINESDKPVKEVPLKENVATFYYVNPGTYYMRLWVDDNDNGQWDTGLYSAQRQAEAVYYYPREIECKANWDVRETWNPKNTPLYLQKPGKITQQKSENRKKVKSRNIERAKSLGLEYNPKVGV